MIAVKYFDQTYQQMFRRVVKKYPNKTMFINTTDDSTWTYAQVKQNKLTLQIKSNEYKQTNCIRPANRNLNWRQFNFIAVLNLNVKILVFLAYCVSTL